MKDIRWPLIFGAWFIATLATLGSLFFSEVMKFPPCILCWYQRICMYPLVLILLTGLLPFDKKVVRFALPVTVTGLIIAIYHNLLYYNILPESAAPCVSGISCTTVQIQWFGFVTIPLLSLAAFGAIFALLILTIMRDSREK